MSFATRCFGLTAYAMPPKGERAFTPHFAVARSGAKPDASGAF